MATKKKANKKPGRGGKIALSLFAALLLALIITAAVGLGNANLLRIRRAEVALENLPQGFDGVTLLYASDIDLCGLNTPQKAGALFSQLESLKPDMLILGGDYNSVSLLDKLNRPDPSPADEAEACRARSGFFHYIRDFHAPLGKFAIAATEDPQWQDLRQAMVENGIQPLINTVTDIRTNEGVLSLAGICGKITNLNDVGSRFYKNDCVVAICEGPDALPALMTSEAADSGPWADLVLCGHTHGGQILLFGRSLLTLTEVEQRFPSGWNTEAGIPILTTDGVGCEGLNLRLGTTPEVWLITLRKK